MITLDNFESNVPYKILMRGLNYYEGTESYEVEISMDGRNVESWYCTCPLMKIKFKL